MFHFDTLHWNSVKPHYVRYVKTGHLHLVMNLVGLYNVYADQYVEDKQFDKSKVDPVTVLHQAVKGLAFLHSIGISE